MATSIERERRRQQELRRDLRFVLSVFLHTASLILWPFWLPWVTPPNVTPKPVITTPRVPGGAPS